MCPRAVGILLKHKLALEKCQHAPQCFTLYFSSLHNGHSLRRLLGPDISQRVEDLQIIGIR